MPNVGLYGDQPLMEQGAAQQGNRTSSQQAGGHRGKGGRSDPSEEELSRPEGSRQATGSADAVIPPRYRSKVGRYFQRLADEVGDQ
jgi:hypothetical protein